MRIRQGRGVVCWGIRDEGTEKFCYGVSPSTFMGRAINIATTATPVIVKIFSGTIANFSTLVTKTRSAVTAGVASAIATTAFSVATIVR